MSRDRDRKLEQALKHELRAAGTPDRDACLDAETLAAWADSGLNAPLMASIETHVSTCARCQAIVGATARSAPAVAVVESPFRFWKWWLAPIAATATAVTLWMVVPEEQQIAVAPPPLAAPAQETFAQPKDQPSPSEPSPAKPAAVEEALARGQRANSLEAARDDRRERPADFTEKREANVAEKKQDADAGKLLQDKSAVGAVSPPSAPAAAAAAPGVREELQKSARPAFASIEIRSPNPAVRWRVIAGTIERTEDGGAAWTPVRPSAGEVITGGIAPTGNIAWFIGSSGLVLVTTDGQAFARVPLPERVDLTAITAIDARSATVTTADGRQFRTDDSGRTWRLIQA